MPCSNYVKETCHSLVNSLIYDVHPVFMERMHNCRQTFTIGFLCNVNRLIETAQNTW